MNFRTEVMGFKRPPYRTVPAQPGQSVFLCAGENEALFMQGEPVAGLVSVSAMGRDNDGLCQIVDFLNDPGIQEKLSGAPLKAVQNAAIDVAMTHGFSLIANELRKHGVSK